MKMVTRAALLLCAAFGANAAAAQDSRPFEPWDVFPGFGSTGVERILRLREELKLTDAQVQQLEEIRKARVQAQQEAIELQSRMAADQLDEAEQTRTRERLRELRNTVRDSEDRSEDILTAEQRAQLRTERLRSAPGFGIGVTPWGSGPGWGWRFDLRPGYRGFGVLPLPGTRNYWFGPSWRDDFRLLPRWRWRGEL